MRESRLAADEAGFSQWCDLKEGDKPYFYAIRLMYCVFFATEIFSAMLSLLVRMEVTAVPTCLQFALSNPTPGLEDEFNRWYGTDHLIHGVLTPGVLAGQRFRRVPGPWPFGKHDYLMIWEIDDPGFALAELVKAKGGNSMPISPAIDMATVQPPTMWRRATVRSAARIIHDTAHRKTVILALMSAIEGKDEALEEALLGGHLGALADLPGVISAELLTLADEQIRGNARKYRFGLLIELIDEEKALRAMAEPLAALPHLDQQRWLAPVFRPIGRRMTTADARAVEAP